MSDGGERPDENRALGNGMTNHFIAALLDRLDEMASEMAERVRRDANLYWLLLTRAGGTEQPVRAMRYLADVFVRRLGDDVPPGRIDFGPAVEIGERREGHRLELATAHGIAAAASAVVRHHVLVLWDGAYPRNVPSLEALLDRLSACEKAVADEIAEDLAAVEDDADDERQMARDAFLRRLTEEPLWDTTDAVVGHAAELDMQIAPPLWLVVLTELRREGVERRAFEGRVAVCFRELGVASLRPLRLHSGRGRTPVELLVVPHSAPSYGPESRQRLTRACEDLDLLAVHAQALTLPAIHPVCVELRRAAPIAGPCSLEHGRAMALDDLSEDQAAIGLPVEVKERLLMTLGRGLGDAKGAARFRTLEAALDSIRPNWATAAAALSAAGERMDPDTVSRRVRAFEMATGLRVDRDLDRINLARRLVRLHADTLPPLDDPAWTSGDIRL